MPKVSIIIPCYNQSRYVQETIQSIISQSLMDWEMILVDDGSTDQTAVLIDQFANKDTRILAFHQNNGGTASAIHYGLQKATGEYILIMGSDDLLSPDKLEKQIAFMENNNLLVSYSGYAHLTDDEQGHRTITYPRKWTTYTLFSFRFSLLTRWGIDYSFPAHSFIYNRQFLLDHNLDYNIPIRQREDWYFHLMVSANTNKIQGIPNLIGAYYRHHPNSKTGEYTKMIDGNCQFLSTIAPKVSGWDKLFVAYRISAEFWMTIGRCVKYHNLQGMRYLKLLLDNPASRCISILSILILPISVLLILIRSISTYIYE